MRWTEQDYDEFIKRTGGPVSRAIVNVSAPPFKLPANQAGAFARGRLPAGQMNKTEAAYADHLEARRKSGGIFWFKFEAIKLRLADKTFYSPDFLVLLSDLSIEAHEVKGFMREDAAVKIKVAASIYPFRFRLVRKGKAGIWKINEVAA